MTQTLKLRLEAELELDEGELQHPAVSQALSAAALKLLSHSTYRRTGIIDVPRGQVAYVFSIDPA